MYYFYTIKQNEKIKIMKAMNLINSKSHRSNSKLLSYVQALTLKVKDNEDKYKKHNNLLLYWMFGVSKYWDMNYPYIVK
jgi:hypothetical protein